MTEGNCLQCGSHRVDGYSTTDGHQEYWCKECGWEQVIEAPPMVHYTITRDHIPKEVLKKVNQEYDKDPEGFIRSVFNDEKGGAQ